jgi:hypothetical protein
MKDSSKIKKNGNAIIGSVFTMGYNKWMVITKGINSWYGVRCESYGNSFISMHIDELIHYIK